MTDDNINTYPGTSRLAGVKRCASEKVRRGVGGGGVGGEHSIISIRQAASVRSIALQEALQHPLPPLHLPPPLSSSSLPVISTVQRKSWSGVPTTITASDRRYPTSSACRLGSSTSSFVNAATTAFEAKMEMDEIGAIGGVMQGQPQQVSGGQVRYFQALIDRTSDLQRRIDLLESRMPDWNWAEECETEKWATWWRNTVCRVTAFIIYNFILCLVSGVLSIYWHLMRSLFLHRSDKERTNDRANIALLILFVKIVSWYCGRKVHTGRILTWALIIVDGLTTAFVYNAGMYSISEKVNMEIVYPLLIAAPQILLYAAILLRVGIRLTLRSRKLGVKRLPFVLAILQSIVLLLVFAIKSRKGSLVENRDLFLHGLAGTVCGMLITLGMACYIVSRLQDKLVSENVREVISMYSLARRADVPSDLMMMPPCELDPGGVGVV